MFDDVSAMTGRAEQQPAEILPLGRDGWLVRFALTAAPWATAAAQVLNDRAQADPPDGVLRVMPSLTSVLFRYDPETTDRIALRARIERLLEGRDWREATPEPAARVWHIPVAFGGDHGPDLDAVSELSGLAAEEVIRTIVETPLRVLAIGFAPGQPYLGLLPEALDLPRMSSINPQVPRGAIALAVRQLVLFPNASPTGWRQVGRCAFRAFRPEAEAPVPLRAGDELRLATVSGGEMDGLLAADDPEGGARCEIRR